MKRVFAFISLFAIALVMFGFGTNVVAASEPAAGKWFENPHLLKDENGNVIEIPMYIMDSITTTFPDFFDYEGAKGTEYEDKNWGGVGRQYAWNGVKIIIPEFSAEGATGNYYGVYPQGASGAGELGIGNMIYTTSATYSGGSTYAVRNAPHDPSLSFYLFNTEEVEWNLNDNKIYETNPYDPIILFDADGKAVSGIVFAASSSVSTVDLATGIGTEYCFDNDGNTVLANADGSNCARELVEGPNDDPNKPMLDDDGNVIGYEKELIPGENPAYVSYRYVWKYMDEAPTNLNNGYLNEGWKADNWDMYNPETKIAVAFLNSGIANAGRITAAEAEADGTVAEGHTRAPWNELAIPVGGLLYKFGYLERNSTLLETFKYVQAQAYLYGREAEYSQTVQCYNYASSEISFQNAVNNGLGLSLIDGTNKIEVVAGEEIDFDKLINIVGVSYAFTDLSDPLSFTSAVMTEAQLTAKLEEFVEAEKAILREEEAYAEYLNWLDKMDAEKAELEKAISDLQEQIKKAEADKAAYENAAEAEILASKDTAYVNEYKALLAAITTAENKVADKEAEIKRLEKVAADKEAAYKDSQKTHKDTVQYKGYAQALSDAKAAHDNRIATVKSYVALQLGNTGLTVTDVTPKATQDKTYEDWTIAFGNAALTAAVQTYMAGVPYADETLEETNKAAVVAAFGTDATDVEFVDAFTAVVEKYIESLVNLQIANTAMHDYVAECLAKTEGYLADWNTAKANVAAAKAELGAASTDKAAATGLHAEVEAAEDARDAFLANHLANNTDYTTLVATLAANKAELEEAKAELGAPSTDSTPATGFYVAYEERVKELDAVLTEAAKEAAAAKYKEWYNTDYANNIALDYTILEDGAKVVYRAPYPTKEAMIEAFLEDFAVWAAANGIAKVNGEYGLGAFISAPQAFFANAEIHAEWGWIFEYVASQCTVAGNLTPIQNAASGKEFSSWYNTTRSNIEIVAFFLDTEFTKVKAELGVTSWTPSSTDYSTLENGGDAASNARAIGWAPTTFADYVLVADENVHGTKHVEVSIYNPIIDKTSTLVLDFVSTIDKYDATPILEINSENLYVTDPAAFDLKSIASAYDRVYTEANGYKGYDISTQIDFVCPELEAALKTGLAVGEYTVEMTITNLHGRKPVTKSAVVKFVDAVAPVVEVRDVMLNYGDDFHFLDGVYFAYDNVEGNLFEADYVALFDESKTGVNTLKAGSYTVTVSAMDKSGNMTEVEYVVEVNENPIDNLSKDVLDAIENVNTAVKDNAANTQEDIKDIEESINNQFGTTQEEIEAAKDAANDKSLVVVATVLAGVAALASIGAVVLVVLKKK